MSEALLGMGSMSITILIAAVLVIVLVIGLVYWALRRRGRSAFMRGGANRQPRLAVLDAAVVDDRRRLVLVRRDHVEHLVMIGGPSDIVVERGINRAARAVQDGTVSQSQVAAAQASAQPRQSQRMEQPQQPRQQPAPAEPPVAPAPAPVIAPILDAPPIAARGKEQEPPAAKAETEDALPKIPVTVPMPEPVKAPEPAVLDTAEAAKTEIQPEPSKTVTAAAVSTALASAADQMAKLEAESDPEDALEPDTPVDDPNPATEAKEEEPVLSIEAAEPAPEVDEPAPTVQVDEPAPAVELEEPATAEKVDEPAKVVQMEDLVAEPAKASASETVGPLELENIFDATNDVDTSRPKTEPVAAEDVQPPAANGNLASEAASPEPVSEESADDAEETVMSAEELIADFDQLLEAEISKAKEQRPEAPVPETGSETVTSLQKQTLEDEMKKLLGDLSVKP